MEIDDFKLIYEDLKKTKIPPVVKKVVHAILDKKGEQIVVLKLKGICEFTDFMVICNGNSSIQNKAISDEIQRMLKKEIKLKAFSVEGQRSSDWILLDYIDFIVNVFSHENREKFSLEKLWMDAKRYDFYIV